MNSGSSLLTIVLALPVAAGLAGVLLPALGYFPALGGTSLSLDPVRDLLGVPGLWKSVVSSIAIGFGATLLAVAASLLFLAAVSGRSLAFVRQGLGPLLAVPHAAAAFGLAVLIMPSGILARLLAGPLGWATPPDVLVVNDPLGLAMTAGLAVKELPFLLLVAMAALPRTDHRSRLAIARALGFGRMAGFAFAVWPSLYRQIRLPVLAVAAYSSSVVDVAIILGPQTPAPLAVRLVQWMSDPDLALRFRASAGALLQLAATAATLLLWLALEAGAGALRRCMADAGLRLPRDRAARVAALLPAGLAGASVLFGIAALGLWSLAALWPFPAILPASVTLRSWRMTLPGLRGPLGTTCLVAFAAALIALVVAVFLFETRRRASPARRAPWPASALLYLPLLVPQVAFVFGLQLLMLGAGLAPSLPLLVAVHLVFVLPYAMLALSDPWSRLDPRFERIAASLGASPLRRFARVRLPLLLAPLAGAFAIGFAVSVGQYLPTLIVGGGRIATVTTEAVALASGGNRRVLGVTALLQTLLPAIVFALAACGPALLHRGRRGMKL